MKNAYHAGEEEEEEACEEVEREREYDVAALRVVAILESCLVLERRAWPKF